MIPSGSSQEALDSGDVYLQAALTRFEAKFVRRGKDDCWIYLGGAKDDPRCPHGAFWFDGRQVAAHRFAYLIYVGEIPDGLWVLHTCDNGMCVNPRHLFLGTALDNNLDCVNKGRNGSQKKTHCPRNHEYTPENTHTDKNNMRHCRRCDRERHVARKQR